MAKAVLKNAPVSLKYAVEFSRELKGMKLDKAEHFLEDIIEQKRFLPLRKYNKKVGHRRGDSVSFTKSGRYPKRTSQVILNLLHSVKSNADYKGLNADSLLIVHFFASQGFRRLGHQNQGRISGKTHKNKSAHLEVAVMEAK